MTMHSLNALDFIGNKSDSETSMVSHVQSRFRQLPFGADLLGNQYFLFKPKIK